VGKLHAHLAQADDADLLSRADLPALLGRAADLVLAAKDAGEAVFAILFQPLA